MVRRLELGRSERRFDRRSRSVSDAHNPADGSVSRDFAEKMRPARAGHGFHYKRQFRWDATGSAGVCGCGDESTGRMRMIPPGAISTIMRPGATCSAARKARATSVWVNEADRRLIV